METQLLFENWGLLLLLSVFVVGSYRLDSRNSHCFFPASTYFSRVFRCNLTEEEEEAGERTADMNTVRQWAVNCRGLSETTSTHFWFEELKDETYRAFDNIARSATIHRAFRSLFAESQYKVEVLPSMNEIYISGLERQDEAFNSDHVFFSRHVDGPFGFIPFVSVYRVLVGLDRNKMFVTHFPLAGIHTNVCKGDVIGFDFNRELHYITRHEDQKEFSDKFRVVLKLHYSVYPKWLAPLGWWMGWLNTRYNVSFRALFLKTLNPANLYEHFLAWQVNANTFLFDRMESIVGLRNVSYLLALCVLWWYTGVYEIFFVMTSFIHYFRCRGDGEVGSFKRDVFLFQTLAWIQLLYRYLKTLDKEADFIALGMIFAGLVTTDPIITLLGFYKA